MWQRYGFFFAGNAAFLPLVARIEYPPLLFSYAIFGMIICWVWNGLLQDDRQVLIWRIQEASKFRWQLLHPDVNVFVFMLREDQLRHARGIYAKAGFLIMIFFFLYPAAAVYLGWDTVKVPFLRIFS